MQRGLDPTPVLGTPSRAQERPVWLHGASRLQPGVNNWVCGLGEIGIVAPEPFDTRQHDGLPFCVPHLVVKRVQIAPDLFLQAL
jgi:hypothetical protein